MPAPLTCDGDDRAPRVTAEDRVDHRHASLGELALLADPRLSKDTVSSRLHRRVALADRAARVLEIPDTASAIAPDLRTGTSYRIPAGGRFGNLSPTAQPVPSMPDERSMSGVSVWLC